MPARRIVGAAVLAAANFGAAQAQPGEPVAAGAPAEELRQVVDRQNDLIRRMISRIEQLEGRVAELEADAGAPGRGAPAAAPPEAEARPGAAAAAEAAEAELLHLTEEERREQERLVRAAFQRTLIERGGLLLPPKTVDVEPSLSYTHSSSENILIDGFTILPVLVVGDIVSEKVQRDVVQATATFRFGLPWSSQLDVSLPFGYHRQRSFTADNEETSISASELGDVTIGFSRQLNRSQGRWPDLLASLRWKTATGTGPFEATGGQEPAFGTGYDSLNLALTGIKVVDPVVYFGSINYSVNYAQDERIGRFDPGDSVGVSLGMAIALNLNSSLSFAYDQQFTRRARVDGLGVPGSYMTTGVFSIGGSFAIGDSLSADFSLGLGVSEDSPDVQIGASFPLRLRF